MTNLRVYVLIFAIASVYTTQLWAQKIEIGAGLGAMNYKGDISPDLQIGTAKLGGNLFFRYNLKKDLSFRASALMGSIAGDDKNSSDPFNQQRGKNFSTTINELSLTAEYNFFNYQYHRYHKDWSPYVFGGVGFMKFSPRDNPSADYKQNQIVLPFGVGIKYNIKGPWDLNFEFGTRKTFTDYLDNLGGNDPTLPKTQQNDYSKGDMYYYTSFSLSFKFIKIYCPPN